MKIAFIGYNASDASCIFRSVWPSEWVNKFTDHSASFYTLRQLSLPDSWLQFVNTDVVVFHKQSSEFVEFARKLAKTFPHIALVFDMDDRDPLVWDYFKIDHWFLDSFRYFDQMADIADGMTCASAPLCGYYRDNGYIATTIENGFDLTLSSMSGKTHDYWSSRNPEDRYAKVVYAGGSNHYPELAWLIDNVFETVCNDYNVDFHVYGISRTGGTARRKFRRGSVTKAAGTSIVTYIQTQMHDAQFLIAPLLAHPFNDYRSTVKCVEAGVARKTIIASDNRTYSSYIGRDSITLVPDDREAWIDAIVRHVNDPDLCRERGEHNRACVEKHYDAQVLTAQRIAFYQQLLDKKR